MVLIVSVDPFGLDDLMMSFLLDIVVHLLFVDLPSVILTVMPMDFSLLDILGGGLPAKQLPFGAFYFIFWELKPY